MKIGCWLCLVLWSSQAAAQTGNGEAVTWRQQYIHELLADRRSPLIPADTIFLRFFPGNPHAARWYRLQYSHLADTIVLATHSGKTKKYREYATVKVREFKPAFFEPWPWMMFSRKRSYRLHIYQSLGPVSDTAQAGYLFLPFTDATSTTITYGGGRYIDLKVADVHKGKILIDFNKAYNPYCAYKEGYNCPIPPRENRLPFDIYAGEQRFAKPVKE